MKVYIPKLNDSYENFIVKDNNENFASTESLKSRWGEKKLKVLGKGKKAELGFCLNPMLCLIMNQRVVDLLKEEFDIEEIELLPLKRDKDIYFILHGMKTYRIFHESVKKGIKFYHKFDKEELVRLEIDKKLFFRGLFNNGVVSQMFYTEKFVELVKKYEIQGVDFEVVWDSEENS